MYLSYGIGQDIKKKDAKAVANKILWTYLSMAAIVGIRNALRALYMFLAGDDKEEDDRPSQFLIELLQMFPIAGGVVASWMNGYSTVPVPAISTASQAIEGVGSVVKAKTPEGRSRAIARTVGAAGQLAGIPGSAEVSGLWRRSIKLKNRGRGRSRNRSRRNER
jgi:hypothetical protein